MVTLTMQKDALTEYYLGLLTRQRSLKAFFDRNIYRMYQKAQLKRWQTENESEISPAHGKWDALNPDYAKRKLKKYAAYDGHGQQLMVATGKLWKATTGYDSQGMRKTVTDRGIWLAVDIGYVGGARYAAERRTVMQFGDATIKAMKRALARYMAKNEMGAGA